MSEQSRPRPSLIAVIMNYLSCLFLFAVCSVMLYLAVPLALRQFQTGSAAPAELAATAPAGNVGGQAPASVRGTNPDPVAPRAIATPIPGIAQSPAEADKLYADAIATSQPIAPATLAAPLPLGSAGDPVIDQTQQQQQALSLQLAEQEANAAADLLLQAQRATAYADAASRPPDVSYADAKALLHGRDPCSVPRADPHTCAQGLFKPTPIGAP